MGGAPGNEAVRKQSIYGGPILPLRRTIPFEDKAEGMQARAVNVLQGLSPDPSAKELRRTYVAAKLDKDRSGHAFDLYETDLKRPFDEMD